MNDSAAANLDLGFIHCFVPASEPTCAPLLLLHGTGGDENDLLALGQEVAPGAALLSPRGKVLENGMPRFFRRHAEGVFDLEDLQRRALELAAFLEQARAAYDLPAPIALGYSNGANIAGALLLLQPRALAGAVLIRATVPFVPSPAPALNGIRVLILSGAADPLVPERDRDRLAQLLASAGAEVSYKVLPAAHPLTERDKEFARQWLAVRETRA